MRIYFTILPLVAEEFGFKIDDAILRGTGAGQPLGILKSGALVTVAKESGQTDKITVENLVKMWSRLWSRSRGNRTIAYDFKGW